MNDYQIEEPRSPPPSLSASQDEENVPKLKQWTKNTALLKEASSNVVSTSSKKSPDLNLIHGAQLPSKFTSQLKPELLGIPLEEIDPYYNNLNTFIVITNRNVIRRFNASTSFNLFHPLSTTRLVCINILHHPAFLCFLGILIVLNYWIRVTSFVSNNNSSVVGWIFTLSDGLFLSACVLDLALKCISAGVILGPCTAFKSPWAWLDLLIILTGFLKIGRNIPIFNAVAALRTLKLIPIVASYLFGFNFIIRTKEKLFDVLIYSIIIISSLALVGMQAFGGLLKSKCIEKMENLESNVINDTEWFNFNLDPTHWLLKSSDSSEFYVCGNITKQCPSDYICLNDFGRNPNFGYTSFNYFGWSILSTIRIISQDAIDSIYFLIPASSNIQQLLYFIIVFFIGTYAIVSFTFGITASLFEESETLQLTTSPQSTNIQGSQAPGRDPNEGFSSNQPSSAYQTLKTGANKIISSCWFDGIIIIFSVLIIFVLCLDHDGIERRPNLFKSLRWTFLWLPIVYVFEFKVKLMANGCKYFQNGLYIYEFVMVLIIFARICLWISDNEFYFWDLINIAMRILPFVKLGARWQTLRFPFIIIWNTLKSKYSAFFHLSIITIFVLAEIGFALYADNYYEKVNFFPHGVMPRWNFGDLGHGVVMIFRIFCGEWIQSLWDGLLVGNVSCLIFFIASLFITYLFLVHMNLAIVFNTMEWLRLNELKSKPIPPPSQEQENHPSSVFKTLTSFRSRVRAKCGLACKRRNIIEGQQSTIIGDQIPMNVINPEETPAIPLQEATFRKTINAIFSHSAFSGLSIGIIIISSACLATEDIYFGKDSSTPLHIFCFITNIIFTVWIGLEIIIKLISFGGLTFLFTLECWFDLILLLERFWVFSMSPDQHNYSVISYLRPLMLVFRIPNLLVAAATILKEIHVIYQYLLGGLTIWLFFGITGSYLFIGTFYKCVDEEGVVPDYRIVKDKIDCLMNNYTWENSAFNFDHIGRSLVSLTAVATFNGWTSIVNDATDSRHINEQPHREVNFGLHLYFILFIIIGVLFLGNVLLGVLVHHFRKVELFQEMLTDNQREVYDSKNADRKNLPLSSEPRQTQAASNTKVSRPNSNALGMAYDLVTHERFDLIITLLLLVDIIGALLHFFLKKYSSEAIWISIFGVVTLFYVLELVLKLLALRTYFCQKYRNILDTLIIIASVGIGIIQLDLSIWGLRILLKSLFIIKLVPFTLKANKSRKNRQPSILIDSMSMVAPAIFNLLGLLLTFMATFGLIGLLYFKHVVGAHASQPVNFETFCNTILVLIQMSFTAGWTEVLDYIGKEFDCESPDAEEGKIGNCGNKKAGIKYIFTYLIISYLIVLNMFIVLVLEINSRLKPSQTKVQQPRVTRTAASAEAEVQQDPPELLEEGGQGRRKSSTDQLVSPYSVAQAMLEERKQSYVVVNNQGENPEEVIVTRPNT